MSLIHILSPINILFKVNMCEKRKKMYLYVRFSEVPAFQALQLQHCVLNVRVHGKRVFFFIFIKNSMI